MLDRLAGGLPLPVPEVVARQVSSDGTRKYLLKLADGSTWTQNDDTPIARAAETASSGPGGITLEQIMADPDWIGPPVETAWWAWDGKHVQYQLKRQGSPIRDTFTSDIETIWVDERAAYDHAQEFLRHAGVDHVVR